MASDIDETLYEIEKAFQNFNWQKIFMDIKTAERNIKLKNWIHLFMGIAFLTPVITLLYKYTGLSLAEIILVSNIGLITVR